MLRVVIGIGLRHLEAMTPTPPTVHVLLAEDNPGDQQLVRIALAETSSNCELHAVGDGVEALEFLRRQGEHVDAPRPDLVLLDLNMPRMGGHEVLEVIKADPDLRNIPMVVLTTSAADKDRRRAYDLHVNSFVRKPVDLDQFFVVMQTLHDFWLATAEKP